MIKFYQKLAKALSIDPNGARMRAESEALSMGMKCKEGVTLPISKGWLSDVMNQGQEGRNTPAWKALSDMIVRAAFVDLSLIRHPYAMKAFRNLAHVLGKNCEQFVFASKLTLREDGRSGIITIHVSDMRDWQRRLKDGAGIECLVTEGGSILVCRQSPMRHI